MVEYKEHGLDDVFGVFSDSTRRAILEHLCEGPATVSELAGPFEISIPGISKHLNKLEAAGLIRRMKEGREVWCEPDMEPMLHASSWLTDQRAFWEVRLDRLEQLLEQQDRQKQPKQSTKPDKEDTDDNESD
jgi:DNA-binding transcriptional ArsR family regulator